MQHAHTIFISSDAHTHTWRRACVLMQAHKQAACFESEHQKGMDRRQVRHVHHLWIHRDEHVFMRANVQALDLARFAQGGV